MIHSSLEHVSIFGSATRNELDERSDLDVLALVKDGGGTVPEEGILSLFPIEQQRKVSISWYGIKKMSKMFKDGHLFAWHLFNESTAIGGSESIGVKFGRPANYMTALEDIEGLIELLISSQTQITNQSPNLIYELGLLYLAARNIAMSASWHLLSSAKFGRYSPFELKQLNFPLELEEYNVLMNCRMASQRGMRFIPDMDFSRSAVISDELLDWSERVKRKVKIEQYST